MLVFRCEGVFSTVCVCVFVGIGEKVVRSPVCMELGERGRSENER